MKHPKNAKFAQPGKIANYDWQFIVESFNIFIVLKLCEDKTKLKYHITKEYTACNICLKIYPTIKSVNIHIKAGHDNITTKHQIEKEPSSRIKKVVKPQ